MINRDKRKGIIAGFKKLGPIGKFAIVLTVVGIILAILFFIYQLATGASKSNQSIMLKLNQSHHDEVIGKFENKDIPRPIVPKNPNGTTTPDLPADLSSLFGKPGVTAMIYQKSCCIIQAPEGSIIQPLGFELPLWFSIENNQLYLDAVIRSSDSQVVTEIHHNKFTINPQKKFKIGQDEHGCEVIDHFGVPVLQVDFINSNTYMVRGVFLTDSTDVIDRYSNFPKRNVNSTCLGLGSGTTFILGDNTFVTSPSRENINKFVGEASRLIPLLFDYSDGALFSNTRVVQK
jgi:hypothetical protein